MVGTLVVVEAKSEEGRGGGVVMVVGSFVYLRAWIVNECRGSLFGKYVM